MLPPNDQTESCVRVGALRSMCSCVIFARSDEVVGCWGSGVMWQYSTTIFFLWPVFPKQSEKPLLHRPFQQRDIRVLAGAELLGGSAYLSGNLRRGLAHEMVEIGVLAQSASTSETETSPIPFDLDQSAPAGVRSSTSRPHGCRGLILGGFLEVLEGCIPGGVPGATSTASEPNFSFTFC